MPFDNSVYLKIREKYIENVKAFRKLGKSKITFNQKTGLFSQEGNFARTFSLRNTEGTSASNKEGFLYPVVGLAYDACIRGLDSMKGISLRRQYLDDLTTIENGLEELRKTYEDQWRNKQSQTTNVASAKNACSRFKKNLETATAGQLQDSYLAANRLFMQATEFRSTYNFRDVVEFTRRDETFNKDAGKIIHIDEKLKNQNYGASIEYLNPIFFYSVKKLSKRIYDFKYSASEENNDPLLATPSEYNRAMTSILLSFKGNGYARVFYQNDDLRFAINTPEYNKVNVGRFLYFKSAPPRPDGTKIGCRLYLNLKNDFMTHQSVLKELLTIICIDKWKSIVSDFKFTHLSSKRKDAVCIYGTDEKKYEAPC